MLGIGLNLSSWIRGIGSKWTKTYVKHVNEAWTYYQKHSWLALDMIFSHYQKFKAFILLIIGTYQQSLPLVNTLSVGNRPFTPKTPIGGRWTLKVSSAEDSKTQIEEDSPGIVSSKRIFPAATIIKHRQ